jgi:DNA-binding transcriptional LysR family regulator
MVPTDAALGLLAPAERLLQEASALFGPASSGRAFAPKQASHTVRIAASDYLDPLFLPGIVARLQREAPGLSVEIHPLSAEFDYRRSLAAGEVDLVIGNWLRPPGELHLGRLTSDEVVCLVAADHPAARNPRAWTEARYLDSDHIAPMPLHAGAPGIIDDHLTQQGKARRITVRTAHFSLAPLMVANSHLVLTTGRQFCQRHVGAPGPGCAQPAPRGGQANSGAAQRRLEGQLPLRIVRCPVGFPAMAYYQLWHERTHASASARWLREQVRDVARELASTSATLVS